MLDEIVKIDERTVLLVFEDKRRPIRIHHDSENPLIFTLWLLSDTHLTFEEFEVALNEEQTIANQSLDIRVG